MRKILVTSALPYANGSIHLGHLLEGIQTDIFVRYQNYRGNEAYFFCADDTHGTPIMLAARREKISPEELVSRIQVEHLRDLQAFGIHYDNYYSTNTPENQFFSEDIYTKLKEKGSISSREISQSYCDHDKMFLPDRFIKGSCPKCSSPDQYGDGCEVCGANYSPGDLLDSRCAICSNKPVLKQSKHLFFKLKDYEVELQNWLSAERVDPAVRNKLNEWFQDGLQEWDISRDGPYFGFKIPGEEDKYFYVWLDAPIGYIASSKNYFEKKNPTLFEEFWKSESTEVIHFIGKDILYFHTLFWPAMLMGAGYRTPSRVNVHGFITVNGEKMSKSRGTFINAETFLKHQDPEHFRFYLSGKLNNSLDDLDLNFQDYTGKVNSDLIGNFVNIFSRVGTSILDKLDRKLGTVSPEGENLRRECLSVSEQIFGYYEDLSYSKAIKEIMKLGDSVNRYVNDNAPWNLIKTDPEKAREVVTNTLNAGKILASYLSPVLPKLTKEISDFLDCGEFNSANLSEKLENCTIKPYKMLSKRVDEKAIEKMIQESKPVENEKKSEEVTAPSKESGLIKIDDLAKVELRVGKIIEANGVEGADKLLNVKVDLGPLGVKNVFAGIKSAYKPEELLGLKVVVVANLEPRKMKFGISEAMLMASGKDTTLSLFVPHRDAEPGDLLK
ncbi:MAG: methionine--tRNA ligase [Leptospiraceae bacterium]|nr:methionine--tRNA ligase [Leptospiraceae bacterium]